MVPSERPEELRLSETPHPIKIIEEVPSIGLGVYDVANERPAQLGGGRSRELALPGARLSPHEQGPTGRERAVRGVHRILVKDMFPSLLEGKRVFAQIEPICHEPRFFPGTSRISASASSMRSRLVESPAKSPSLEKSTRSVGRCLRSVLARARAKVASPG